MQNGVRHKKKKQRVEASTDNPREPVFSKEAGGSTSDKKKNRKLLDSAEDEESKILD